jgi:hypothetical protein
MLLKLFEEGHIFRTATAQTQINQILAPTKNHFQNFQT